MKLSRRAALASLATFAKAGQPVNDFDHLVRQFNQHWDKFLRAYLACPPEVGTERDCKPALGRIDYPEFQRAEKAARKLFDLKG